MGTPAPPPPPPPGPPSGWLPPPVLLPPPPPGTPFFPVAAPWTRPVSPQGARRAIEQIRASIGIYRWVPVLSIIATLLLAVLAAALGVTVISAGLGQSFTLPQFNNTTANVSPSLSGAGASALSGASSLVGIVSLVVTVVGWVSWRSGIRQLRQETGTPWSPPAAVEETHRYYRATVALFLANIVAAVALTVVVIITVVSSIVRGGASPTSFAESLRLTVISALVIGGGLGTAMYACAGTSLRAPLRPLLTPPDDARIDRARWLLVLGAAFSWSALLGYVSPWLLFVAVAGPVLLFLGFQEFRAVYGAWLERNPGDLSSLPAPPVGVGSPRA